MPEPVATALPRILADVREVVRTAGDSRAAGAAWRLAMPDRDLDANIIHLPAAGGIDAHEGPELDVLVLVLAGSAQIESDTGEFDVPAGSLVWLPRRSRRSFTAGPDGATYLTVHQRRQALVLSDPRSSADGDSPVIAQTPLGEPW